MHTAINFERSKLNHSMYQKLKKYIMNKRKERHLHDAYFNKLKLEREERRHQALLDKQCIEKIKQEAVEVSHKLQELKAKRNELFERLKLIANEESQNRLKLKHESEMILANSQTGLFGPPNPSTNMTNERIQVANSKSTPKPPNPQIQSPQLPMNSAQTMNVFQQALTSKNSNFAFQEMINNLIMSGAIANNSNERSTSSQPVMQNKQQLSVQEKCQISQSLLNSQQSESQTKSYMAALESLMKQPHQLTPSELAILSQIAMYPTSSNSMPRNNQQQNPSSTSNVGMSSSKAPTHLSNSLLPPAQMGYRGSITTGQSNQQLHLQQQMVQQSKYLQKQMSNQKLPPVPQQMNQKVNNPYSNNMTHHQMRSQQQNPGPTSSNNQQQQQQQMNMSHRNLSMANQQNIDSETMAKSVFSNWNISALQKAVQQQQHQNM